MKNKVLERDSNKTAEDIQDYVKNLIQEVNDCEVEIDGLRRERDDLMDEVNKLQGEVESLNAALDNVTERGAQ